MSDRILRLSPQVVDKIAAGEVIQRPVNAAKELVENSLDAGATAVNITVKNGGLKLLQIQDNGSGIQLEDLNLVCERFTTSKLQKYEDLGTLQTHGFRGEALASISHVAHLSITTKTKDSVCAYRAHYQDGKLVPSKPSETADPKPCAGVGGTIITVENLFFNVPARRNALRSPSEEYNKLLEFVMRTAVHKHKVSFSCKKQGESASDVQTASSASRLDVIRSVFGPTIARELIEIEAECEQHSMKFTGHFSNANFHSKKLVFILFINDRLVESSALRRAIESIYTTYLPKNMHPWVYVSLDLATESVDVNVHPTKKEVRFLNEEEIVEFVATKVSERLVNSNASRTFLAQRLMPGATSVDEAELKRAGSSNASGSGTPKAPAPNAQVRTGAHTEAGQIEGFLVSTNSQATARTASQATASDDDAEPRKRRGEPSQAMTQRRKQPRQRSIVHLTSVQTLIAGIEGKSHEELTNILRNHAFVGVVDKHFVLIQHSTRLYVIDIPRFSKEAFYQCCLQQFANFLPARLDPPAPIATLVLAALESPAACWTEQDGSKADIAKYVVNLLEEKGPMLAEYFAIVVRDGKIHSLPQVVDGFTPPVSELPMFLLRLATEVEWDSEMPCFESLSREIAEWCCLRDLEGIALAIDAHGSEATAMSVDEGSASPVAAGSWRKTAHRLLQHTLLPSWRFFVLPPQTQATDGSFVQVACTQQLYKIFERC